MKKSGLVLVLALVALLSTSAVADPININFAGGAGGFAQFNSGDASWALIGAPLSVIQVGSSLSPLSGTLSILLPGASGSATLSGVSGYTYSSGLVGITGNGGQNLVVGTLSSAFLGALDSTADGTPTLFFGVFDASNTAYFGELSSFNPFQSGAVINISLLVTADQNGSFQGSSVASSVGTIGTVPEPASLVLLGSGLLSSGAAFRWRFKNKAA